MNRIYFSRITIILIVFCVIFYSSCNKSDSSQTSDNRLIIYSTHGKENVDPVIDRFKLSHPDINVEWRQFATVNLFNAVKVESNDPQCDLWWGGPHTTFIQAELEGLLQPYRPSWHDAIPDDAKSANDMWYGNFRMPECIMYNANVLTKEEAPQEWDDLILPQWNKKIVLRDPSKSGTMKAIFGAMIWRTYKINKSAEEGFVWLNKLHENVAYYAPDPRAMYQALNTSETPVTVWNMVDAHIQSQQGYNFKTILPASGIPVLVEGIALIKNSNNTENAKIFYEWVTSEEELIDQANEFHRIPARLDIDQSKLPSWMIENEIKPMDIDTKIYQPLEQLWMDRFRSEIQIK